MDMTSLEALLQQSKVIENKLAMCSATCNNSFIESQPTRKNIMHVNANKLIGKSIQKVESKKRGIVASVENGWLSGSTIVVFVDGYKGMYQDKDVAQLLLDGTHNHNCE